MPWPLLWLWFKVWVFFFSSNRENKGSKNITTLPYWLAFTLQGKWPKQTVFLFLFLFFFFFFFFWKKFVLLFPSSFFLFFFFLNMCCHWPMTCEWIIDGRKTRSEWIIIRHFWGTIMFISIVLNWLEKVWFQTCLKPCTPTSREMILDPFNPINQANCVYCTWREICHLHIGSWNQTSSWLST